MIGTIVLWIFLPYGTKYEVAGFFHSALMNAQGGDLLRRTLHKEGRQSLDCGRVRRGADPAPATHCAMAAFTAGKSFHVRYDMQGIDSDVAIALASFGDGKVQTLLFDGDPDGQGGTWIFRQRVSRQPCPLPVRLSVTPQGRLKCFPTRRNAQQDVMSPTFERY